MFWFNEAYLLNDFDFKKFSATIRNEIVKFELRIGHYPNGKTHDYGSGFRVIPSKLPKCFANIKKL